MKINYNTKLNNREDITTRRYLFPLGQISWEPPRSFVRATSWKRQEPNPFFWTWSWKTAGVLWPSMHCPWCCWKRKGQSEKIPRKFRHSKFDGHEKHSNIPRKIIFILTKVWTGSVWTSDRPCCWTWTWPSPGMLGEKPLRKGNRIRISKKKKKGNL